MAKAKAVPRLKARIMHSVHLISTNWEPSLTQFTGHVCGNQRAQAALHQHPERVFAIVASGRSHWLSPLLRFLSSGQPWLYFVLLESLKIFPTPLTRVCITHLYTVCAFVVKVGVPNLHLLDSRHQIGALQENIIIVLKC